MSFARAPIDFFSVDPQDAEIAVSTAKQSKGVQITGWRDAVQPNIIQPDIIYAQGPPVQAIVTGSGVAQSDGLPIVSLVIAGLVAWMLLKK